MPDAKPKIGRRDMLGALDEGVSVGKFARWKPLAGKLLQSERSLPLELI
jgi:hypothetical protein